MLMISVDSIDFVDKSGVTAKGYRHRTTIPSRIFKKWGLEDKDELRWVLLKDGTAIVSPQIEKKRKS